MFVMGEKSITLIPLTPMQVYEDQIRIKIERDTKKESEL